MFLKEIKKESKMIISFSLWGDDLKYINGAISNVKLAQRYYPNWICRFHIPEVFVKQNDETVNFFMNSENVEIVVMQEDANWRGLLWRFLPCSDKNVKMMISRDCDSRVTKREIKSVKSWIKSKKKFHIMRDHPNHNYKILGGMWGVVCDKYLENMDELINNYLIEDRFNIDQEFLEEIIYPFTIDNSYINDPFFDKIPFSTLRWNFNFIGNVYDFKDRPNEMYKKILRDYIQANRKEILKMRLKHFFKLISI